MTWILYVWLAWTGNGLIQKGLQPPRGGCHFEYAIHKFGLGHTRLPIVYCQGDGRLLVPTP